MGERKTQNEKQKGWEQRRDLTTGGTLAACGAWTRGALLPYIWHRARRVPGMQPRTTAKFIVGRCRRRRRRRRGRGVGVVSQKEEENAANICTYEDRVSPEVEQNVTKPEQLIYKLTLIMYYTCFITPDPSSVRWDQSGNKRWMVFVC